MQLERNQDGSASDICHIILFLGKQLLIVNHIAVDLKALTYLGQRNYDPADYGAWVKLDSPVEERGVFDAFTVSPGWTQDGEYHGPTPEFAASVSQLPAYVSYDVAQQWNQPNSVGMDRIVHPELYMNGEAEANADYIGEK